MKAAESLLGLALNGGWTVKRQVTPGPNSSGGKFSVGYIVEDQYGNEAYLKALDFSSAFQASDPARELQAMTSAYNYERDLLAKCKTRSLRRIVTPLDDGTVFVPGNFGPLGNVSYLIFELATGDIRNQVAAFQSLDLAWCLRSLHHSSVGIQQLHSAGIVHQDLKPSNVLVFHGRGSKLADLGRASDSNIPSPTDGHLIPGDVGYAPPEQFYHTTLGRTFNQRCLADLYLLGSLVFFYFAKCSASHALKAKLSGLHGINFTNTDFDNDLPYLRQAFQESVIDLESQIKPIAGDLTPRLMVLVKQLCEPDPKRRGDPKHIGTVVPQYTLNTFVSALDLLAKKAESRIT